MANKRLNATIVIGGTITGALKGALKSSADGVKRIGSEMQALQKRQALLGKSIQTFARMGRDVDGLRSSYARTVEQVDRLRHAQERLNKAQSQYKAMKGVSGKLVAAGASAAVAGASIGGVLSMGVHAAIQRENAVAVIRNSGVSKEDADAMIGAAKNSRQFGVSVTKATDTVSELRTALGDAHHAIQALPSALKAISGLQLYDRLHHTDMASGDSAYQMAKVSEERGGATDPKAMREKYNWAFKALTGSNGKVTIGDLLTSVRSGKGAVQAMSDEAFFGDTFLQQSMGADRYGTSSSSLVNAWIGGHQTHSAFDHMLQMGLLNRKGVRFDKNGRVKTVSPDALVDAQTFLKDPQKWVDEHLVPLAKKQGVDVNDPAQVMKFVGAIASNPNAANMLLSRIRFGASIWKDRHNVIQANGVDDSDNANRNSTAGKVDNARARLDDAQARVGNVLIPAFATAMERTATILESVNRFADENPRLMKGVVMGLGGLAVGLTVAAPVLVTAAGALHLFSTIKLARTVASLRELETASSGVSKAASSAGGGVMGFIGKLGMIAALAEVALGVAKAAGLPDVDKSQGQKDVANGNWWAASAHLSAGDFIKAGWAHLTGGDKAPAAVTPTVPPMATAPAKAAPQVADNRQFHVTIHQQPGQSSESLANDVTRKLGAPKQSALGSGLYDTGF
ncbi:hypothetical protein [Paraburkholderia sp.]|uniref:hypothetical protein n=1 Tax=Paraburkholderia sp. TaxID=1926495 RepID=UPI002600D542|nr:hypothetical protein [Paraburkholderia sp.]